MGALFALLTAVLYGLTNVLVRRGHDGGGDNGVLATLAINLVLYLAAGLAALALREPAVPTAAGLLWFAVLGLLINLGGRFTFFGAIARIGPSRASAIKNSSPLVTIAIAVLALGEALTPLAAVGTTLVLGGIWLIGSERPSPARPAMRVGLVATPVGAAADPAHRLGLLLAVLTALAFGLGDVVRKAAVAGYPDPLLGSAVSTAVALLGLLALRLGRGERWAKLRCDLWPLRRDYLAAGVTGGLAQITFLFGVLYAPVSLVSVLAATAPLLTMLFSRLLLRSDPKEPWSTRLVASVAIACCGSLLLLSGR